MSRTAVLIALALAAVLSVAAAILLAPPGANPAGPPTVVLLDPAAVSSVSYLDHATKSTRTIAPAPDPQADPGLFLTVRNADGTGFARPIDAAKWTAALRTLAAAPNLGPVDAPDSATASTLELQTASGPIRISLGAAALAGRLPVKVEQNGSARSLAASADVFSYFTGDAAAMLDPAVFRWPNEPTEIRLDRNGPAKDRLVFVRAGRVWRLTQPVETAADRGAVGNLQAALSNLRFKSAAPHRPGPIAGEAGVGVFFADADAPRAQRARQSLILLGRTGEVEAISSSDVSDCALILRDADLAPIFADVASFISKLSLDRPAADAMVVQLRRPAEPLHAAKSIRRRADDWTLEGAALAPGDARSLAGLLETLANTPAAAVTLTPPADFEAIASVAVLGLGDAVLGDRTVGIATSPAAAAAGRQRRILCVLQNQIARFYAVEAGDPSLAWLRTFVP